MRMLPVIMLTSALFGALGCEKALFPRPGDTRSYEWYEVQRSQYERYQILHGEYRRPTETNAFGGEEPALRARLRPLGQP